jgi:deoxycytidine triphosphate deaminase
MILGNEAIKKAHNSHTGWAFTNCNELMKNQVQSASVDIHLADVFKHHVTGERLPLNANGNFDLPPYGFVLAQTVESIWLSPFLAAQVATRSSGGREAIDVCGSAGWIDPGYSGYITLEISNRSDCPVELKVGKSYCQLKFSAVLGCTEPYRGKYGGPQQDESDMMSKGVEKYGM